MTQERTEQRDMAEIREAFYRMIKGEHSLHVPAQTSDEDFVIGAALDELEAARAEIDRLNATITDLTAKVQERDKEIERLRAEMQSSADDLRELMEVAYRDCPYEAQKIADRLVAALKGAE